MSKILQGLNEGRDSWDSNMPGYKGDYGGADNWDSGKRNFRRQEAEQEWKREQEFARQQEELAQYNKTGNFWLKLKDTQQHLPAGPFIGKQAANAAALDLLKQQPELKGNLVITAYGPDEKMAEAKEAEYGAEWDEKVKRVGQMAKQGERKTVWDPVKRVYKTVPVNQSKEVDEETNPHTSAIGKALFRDLSKEKKASPAQVQRNKERWAKRQAEREQGVAEDTVNESSTIDFIRGLISEFNTQMSGSPYYPMDYKNPGMRMWTRGDGSRYKDPGYIFIDRDLKPEDQPKWHKAKAVEKFWKFLESKGARKIGDVSGEFGSDPHSPAVVLNKQVFVFNGRSIAWGSTSRLKNSSVWRQKQQGVAEGWDSDTTRLEQDVRDALENGDDYTAKQYAKMAPTPEAKKYLLNIIKQAMYLDDLGGEIDWKGVSEDKDPCWDNYKQIGMKTKDGRKVPNCVPKEGVEEDKPTKYRATVEYGPTAADVHFVTVTASSTEEAEQKVEAWCERKGVRNPMITINGADKPIDEDWQKVNKSDKTDGMSKKAVKAYRRENPGSKLKTAVTTKPSKLKKGSKDAKRRKSFCARMSGMKKAHASAKTKRDPDSPINKALRRWNCESVEQLQELMMIAEAKIAEAKNAKQQAAIAVNMKKAGKKPQQESAIEKGLIDENLGTPYPSTYEQETLPYRTKGQKRTQAIAFEDKKDK